MSKSKTPNNNDANISVISWNVLNHRSTRLVPKQADRLQQISETLISHIDARAPSSIIFLCEVADKSHFSTIAKTIGFEVANEPIQYSTTEWMGFLIKGITDYTVSPLPFDKPAKKHSYLKLEQPTIDIIGVHYPHKIMRDNTPRISLSKQIIYAIEPRKHTIVAGDFNSLHSSRSRKLYELAGLKQTHKKLGPSFPSGELRGRSVPMLTPPLPIDTMYYTKKMELHDVAAYNTPVSDHPIIRSSFRYT